MSSWDLFQSRRCIVHDLPIRKLRQHCRRLVLYAVPRRVLVYDNRHVHCLSRRDVLPWRQGILRQLRIGQLERGWC